MGYRTSTIIALVLTGIFLAGNYMYLFSASWGDGFSIILTPAGDRGVKIDTDTINIGDLSAGTTYVHQYCIPVTSTGTISGIEYTIQAATSTPASTLSNDGIADQNDEIVLQVLFNSQLPSTSAWEQYGPTTNLVTFSPKPVGDTTTPNTNFEGDEDMDDLGLNVERHLWFRIKTPPAWTSGTQQTITVTITAEPAN
jgi:hypothetical protein